MLQNRRLPLRLSCDLEVYIFSLLSSPLLSLLFLSLPFSPLPTPVYRFVSLGSSSLFSFPSPPSLYFSYVYICFILCLVRINNYTTQILKSLFPYLLHSVKHLLNQVLRTMVTMASVNILTQGHMCLGKHQTYSLPHHFYQWFSLRQILCLRRADPFLVESRWIFIWVPESQFLTRNCSTFPA